MKNSFISGIVLLMFLLFPGGLHAQDGKSLRYVSVDAGIDGYIVALKDYPYIRGDLSAYGSGSGAVGKLGSAST